MKQQSIIAVIFAICLAASVQAADPGKASAKAHGIIDKKCTACHSKDKIDAAISSGKNMAEIQKLMEKKGVKLSSNESEVLGIFWKESKPISKK